MWELILTDTLSYFVFSHMFSYVVKLSFVIYKDDPCKLLPDILVQFQEKFQEKKVKMKEMSADF